MAETANSDETVKKVSTKYKTESLLTSKALAGYQPDFVKVLLTESEYTLEDAKGILDKFFGKKEGK